MPVPKLKMPEGYKPKRTRGHAGGKKSRANGDWQTHERSHMNKERCSTVNNFTYFCCHGFPGGCSGRDK